MTLKCTPTDTLTHKYLPISYPANTNPARCQKVLPLTFDPFIASMNRIIRSTNALTRNHPHTLSDNPQNSTLFHNIRLCINIYKRKYVYSISSTLQFQLSTWSINKLLKYILAVYCVCVCRSLWLAVCKSSQSFPLCHVWETFVWVAR